MLILWDHVLTKIDYDKDGVSGKKIEFTLRMRISWHDRVQDYADNFKVDFSR